MTLKYVRATFECDGCQTPIVIDLDTGDKLYGVGDGSLHDYAEDGFRGGHTVNLDGFTSIQGDHQLCPACTRVVDEACSDDPSYDEVKAALDEHHGV